MCERCKLRQRGVGRSPSRNLIWCILALKSVIWWQQFLMIFLSVLPNIFLWPHYSGAPEARGPGSLNRLNYATEKTGDWFCIAHKNCAQIARLHNRTIRCGREVTIARVRQAHSYLGSQSYFSIYSMMIRTQITVGQFARPHSKRPTAAGG